MTEVTDRVAMVRRAASRGRFRRAMAMATGRRPRPTPCRARPMINTVKPLDTAESTQPTTTAPRATRMTARWRGPSASRPITGVARAPVSRVMVRIHSPVLSDTPSARDRVGMRGAPRLDTTAMRDPANTRVGTRSRRRSEARSSAPMGSDEPVPGGSTVVVMEVPPHSSSGDVII
jgi:hypothetical protein